MAVKTIHPRVGTRTMTVQAPCLCNGPCRYLPDACEAASTKSIMWGIVQGWWENHHISTDQRNRIIDILGE